MRDIEKKSIILRDAMPAKFNNPPSGSLNAREAETCEIKFAKMKHCELMLMELKVISKSLIIIIHRHPESQREQQFRMRVCYASSRQATHTKHEQHHH